MRFGYVAIFDRGGVRLFWGGFGVANIKVEDVVGGLVQEYGTRLGFFNAAGSGVEVLVVVL